MKEESEKDKSKKGDESEEEELALHLDKASKNINSEDNSPVKTNTHLVIGDSDLKHLEVQVKD